MLHTVSQIALTGVGFTGVALSINRAALGVFFAISGYHKLFNRQRHATIAETMVSDRIPFARAMSWFVPSVEFLGGLGLTVGLLSPIAAFGLFCVCFVATCTDGLRRIPGYHPIDKADALDDFLYLPEVLYCIALVVVICAGPGSISLDSLISSLI